MPRRRPATTRGFPLEILYEDRDLIAVNKPAGILSTPFKGGHSRNLLEILKLRAESRREKIYPVHRIDRYTSGVVVFAKSSRIRAGLIRQFRSRRPERVYLAVVNGHLRPAEGRLTHCLRLISRSFKQVPAAPGDMSGARAELEYRTLNKGPDFSVLEVRLITGLKNQIRAQLAAIGHALLGDRQYGAGGDGRLDRQALHAARLVLEHPGSGKRIEIAARPPHDLRPWLEERRTRDG